MPAAGVPAAVPGPVPAAGNRGPIVRAAAAAAPPVRGAGSAGGERKTSLIGSDGGTAHPAQRGRGRRRRTGTGTGPPASASREGGPAHRRRAAGMPRPAGAATWPGRWRQAGPSPVLRYSLRWRRGGSGPTCPGSRWHRLPRGCSTLWGHTIMVSPCRAVPVTGASAARPVPAAPSRAPRQPEPPGACPPRRLRQSPPPRGVAAGAAPPIGCRGGRWGGRKPGAPRGQRWKVTRPSSAEAPPTPGRGRCRDRPAAGGRCGAGVCVGCAVPVSPCPLRGPSVPSDGHSPGQCSVRTVSAFIEPQRCLPPAQPPLLSRG